MLERTRATKSQVGLDASARQSNVRGAFQPHPPHAGAIAGANIVLVDDVVTTGATANACAQTLKRAGAARVDVLAFAVVVNTARASAKALVTQEP